MQFNIKGQSMMPVLEAVLQPGDAIVSESGELSWMAGDIQMTTATGFGANKKGFLGGIKRAFAGGTFFMTEYRGNSGVSGVAFSIRAPGQFIGLDLDGTKEYAIHRHGFVCAEHDVALEIFFQKNIGAGIFGGEGFVLQKLSGTGKAYVETHGELFPYDLVPGQTMRIHPGHIAMFETTCNLTLTTVPGIKNKIFGGDGLFLAQLEGPGRIWLQSLSLSRIAHSLAPYLPAGEASNNSGISIGGIDAGNLFRGGN